MSIKPIGGIILRKGSKKGSYNFPKNSPNLDSLILGTQEVKEIYNHSKIIYLN